MLVILYRVGIPKVARNLRSIDNTTRNNIPQDKFYISVITLLKMYFIFSLRSLKICILVYLKLKACTNEWRILRDVIA